jgi:hypothetical protein
MGKSNFVSFISWVIIVSLMAELVGCSTFQQVENWKEYPERDIRVTTKGGATYDLTRWKVAASGGITAEGEVHYPNPRDYFEMGKSNPFRGTIPADSIANVEVWKTDVVLTTLAVIGSIGTIGILYLFIFQPRIGAPTFGGK